jgi:hypothetical protein
MRHGRPSVADDLDYDAPPGGPIGRVERIVRDQSEAWARWVASLPPLVPQPPSLEQPRSYDDLLEACEGMGI